MFLLLATACSSSPPCSDSSDVALVAVVAVGPGREVADAFAGLANYCASHCLGPGEERVVELSVRPTPAISVGPEDDYAQCLLGKLDTLGELVDLPDTLVVAHRTANP